MVITQEQNEVRQLKAMRDFWVRGRTSSWKSCPAGTSNAPRYQNLVKDLRQGDVLVIVIANDKM